MAQPVPIITRTYKRGQTIFVPGPGSPSVFVVQTGLVSVVVLKDGCAQLQLVRPWQILREDALMAGPASGTTAIALKDTQVVEVPVDVVRTLGMAAPPPLGVL